MKKWLFRILVLVFILLNVSAYLHARAMTNFKDGGERTPSPRNLSGLEKYKVLFTGIRVPKPVSNKTPESAGLTGRVETFPSLGGEVQLTGFLTEVPAAQAAVLLLHDYASTRAQMYSEAKYFNDLGYSTFCLDFRASGESSGYRTTMGFREADDVIAAHRRLNKLVPNLPTVIYGRSMGSVATLRAIAFSEITPTALILEAPFDTFINSLKNRFNTMGVPAFPAAHVLALWGGAQNRMNALQFNPYNDAISVQSPTMILIGSDDPYVKVEEAERVYNALPLDDTSPGNGKQMHVFPDFSRGSFLTEDPAKFKLLVGAFLDHHISGADKAPVDLNETRLRPGSGITPAPTPSAP